MLPRPAGASVIRTALGGRCGFPAITGSHQLSHVDRQRARLAGPECEEGRTRDTSSPGSSTASAGSAAAPAPARRSSRKCTRGTPRQAAPAPARVVRIVTRAIPPSRLGTNVTCPCTFRSAARATRSGPAARARRPAPAAVDAQGTAGPSASGLALLSSWSCRPRGGARASSNTTTTMRGARGAHPRRIGRYARSDASLGPVRASSRSFSPLPAAAAASPRRRQRTATSGADKRRHPAPKPFTSVLDIAAL